jgi:transcriptional regulator GlxA family with amidase domain
MTSVCTGALLLGEAGLLDGKCANTHWTFRAGLRSFGATPVERRWVEDGQVITVAGVDMALRLIARLAGDDVAKAIQFAIEYDPEPLAGRGARG